MQARIRFRLIAPIQNTHHGDPTSVTSTSQQHHHCTSNCDRWLLNTLPTIHWRFFGRCCCSPWAPSVSPNQAIWHISGPNSSIKKQLNARVSPQWCITITDEAPWVTEVDGTGYRELILRSSVQFFITTTAHCHSREQPLATEASALTQTVAFFITLVLKAPLLSSEMLRVDFPP